MRVLLAVEEFDYGRRDQGPSYANQSLTGPLTSMGHQVQIFDTLDEAWAGNRAAIGAALSERVRIFAPDLVLSMLMKDELPLDAVRSLRGRTVTANWFPDDVWRFRSFSRYVAPAFDWALTTARSAERAYRGLGINAMYLPWGFNPKLFHPVEATESIDVLFIGQRHGRRARVVERLRSAGIRVATRGSGWPEGRVDASQLAALYASSKVNLNFLESSGGHLRARGVTFRGSGRLDDVVGRVVGYPRQLKARAFEIPACGAFMLTDSIAELEECFVPGREIGVAQSYRQLRRAIDYWLSHPEKRRAVAAAGAARAASDHSYETRLEALFARIGLT